MTVIIQTCEKNLVFRTACLRFLIQFSRTNNNCLLWTESTHSLLKNVGKHNRKPRKQKNIYDKKFPFSTFLLWKEDCPNQEPLFNTFQKSILMCQHQFCRIKTKVLLIKSYGELFLWNSCYPIIDDFCFWKNSFPWNP